ncbi:MORN repeat-containing protein 2-like isoform X2 [Halichondria panicea]|uniref:MORN repeat-containing protein 2-like isoform X2 n=1 Tax=Halichondria panicea TaxID=6063 RepID=UPI00312BCACF
MPGKSQAKQHESKAGGTKKLTDSYIFPDGEKYVGEYVDYGNGVIERNGEGTHSFSSGLVYKGTWSKDKMNGTGELIHPNDCTYKGTFVENEYHGSGVFQWPDGSMFTGQFTSNRISGNGEFKDSAGRTWIGECSMDSKTLLNLKLS